ncbi:MAG: Elongation factor P [Microgenomates bacterium 39_7]|nr:MAG: Elongation factor P [Microgenomates bacterium 39_7]
MAKVKAGNIETGMFLMHNGHPHRVIKKKFVSPGKGSAFCRTKLTNLETGATIEHVFKSHDTLEEVFVESKQMQFLYLGSDAAVFMDQRNYEQIEISLKVLGDAVYYLVPETKAYISFYEGKPIAVSLPPKVELEVTESEDAIAGDRSNSGTKPITTETGLVVQVPLFIKKGERLIIDTTSGEYVSRA